MFVVIYQGSDDLQTVSTTPTGLNMVGQWRVDTTSKGGVAQYEDLAIALERVQYIRDHGGEACLAAIIE